MHSLASLASLASLIALVGLAPSAALAAPAGVNGQAAFECNDGSGFYPSADLILKGGMAKALISLADGTHLQTAGTDKVEIAGSGTRTTGFPIHSVKLNGSEGTSFELSLIENPSDHSLKGNGLLVTPNSAPVTWIGSCYPVE